MTPDQVRVRVTLTMTRGRHRATRSSVVERIDVPMTRPRVENWATSEVQVILDRLWATVSRDDADA